MSTQHYEQLLEMKKVCGKSLETRAERTTSTINALYSQITSAESAKAFDLLFSATPDDLKKSFSPKATKSSS